MTTTPLPIDTTFTQGEVVDILLRRAQEAHQWLRDGLPAADSQYLQGQITAYRSALYFLTASDHSTLDRLIAQPPPKRETKWVEPLLTFG